MESQPEQPTRNRRTTTHQRATRASERTKPTNQEGHKAKHLQTLTKGKNPLPLTESRTVKKLHNTIIFYVTPVFIKTHQAEKARQTEERHRKKTETARKNLLTLLLFLVEQRENRTPRRKPSKTDFLPLRTNKSGRG